MAMITKSIDGTISSISVKTAMKIFAYNAYSSIGSTIWSGLTDASDNDFDTKKLFLLSEY